MNVLYFVQVVYISNYIELTASAASCVRPAYRLMSRTRLNELCGRQMMARWKPRRASFPTRGGSIFSDENCARMSLYMSNIPYDSTVVPKVFE